MVHVVTVCINNIPDQALGYISGRCLRLWHTLAKTLLIIERRGCRECARESKMSLAEMLLLAVLMRVAAKLFTVTYLNGC